MKITEIVERARKAYDSGKTLSLEWRKTQLLQIAKMMNDEQELINEAVQADLHKPLLEMYLHETGPTFAEAMAAYENLEEWAKPQPGVAPMVLKPFSTYETRPEPRGVVLVIGCWNFPVNLHMGPLIAAIAAGNAVVMKMSEVSPHTSQVLEKLCKKYLDNDAIQIVSGGLDAATAVLKEKFDFICYTGSTTVGKIVHKAAAAHLTPTLLELGGRNPVLINNDIDIKAVAKRIMWAKTVNAGQMCIAPNHLVVLKPLIPKLVEALKEAEKSFFGEITPAIEQSRIVNSRHFERLEKVLNAQLSLKHTQVAIEGVRDPETRFFSTVVLTGVKMEDPIMQDEIFGPLLPIISVDSMEQGIQVLKSLPSPLALYVMTSDKKLIETVATSVRCGNFVANDFMVNMAAEIPFGGCGESGMGSYHGKFGFDSFSHFKSCVIRPAGLELLNQVRYPSAPKKLVPVLSWILFGHGHMAPKVYLFLKSLLKKTIGNQLLQIAVAFLVGYYFGFKQ